MAERKLSLEDVCSWPCSEQADQHGVTLAVLNSQVAK